MQKRRRGSTHRAKRENKEDQVLEHRQRCRGPAWWSRYDSAQLQAAQDQGQALREGGYGSINWDELLGRP